MGVNEEETHSSAHGTHSEFVCLFFEENGWCEAFSVLDVRIKKCIGF